MKEITYTIPDPQGIHARPAGVLTKKAKEFACSVTMKKGDKTADAKKMFAVMGLAVKNGETVTFTLEGEDEEQSAVALEQMLKENL